jgi:hypothetical protein
MVKISQLRHNLKKIMFFFVFNLVALNENINKTKSNTLKEISVRLIILYKDSSFERKFKRKRWVKSFIDNNLK